ncbi:MAG: Nif3-like dinuclear metal center hexameric protein [Burkholderiales bacterium]|jgi:dinuclear metal center YbgI/SA1388 family protein|nr:Nif3-like dinuclear metal center hexameric protein [Burkholderiales bacterium]
MASRSVVEAYLNNLLDVGRFRDYGPNGLQVEGKAEIAHLVCGVTASLALIEAAVEQHADAILVHHGLFWHGQDGRVTGWLKRRLELLLRHAVNLFAYHLPLDAHPEWGNNAQFGQRLKLRAEEQFGEQALGCIGTLPCAVDLAEFGREVATQVGRVPTTVGGDGRPIRRVAWCTGGAQGYFEAAIAAGADVYVTGELSEPQAHYARESGVAFIACGHHASERFGAPALGAHLASVFGLQLSVVEIDNPA